MCRLIDDITAFLESEGFECSRQMRHGFDVICTRTADGRKEKLIIPLEIKAETLEEAVQSSEHANDAIRMASREKGGYPLIITEDRWMRQGKMMRARLLAHLELFSQAYARNCEVRRIEKAEAQSFLKENHSYGYAACRYRYGLFLKRHTGHIAEETENCDGHIGRLIAVATFSNARRWMKDGKEISSYEWTRYASLPEMRISGGMGKLLKAFINDVNPDDIMSYADLEWSEGRVYEALGFKVESGKDAVDFIIDGQTWERRAVRSLDKLGMTEEKSGMTEEKSGMTEQKSGMTEQKSGMTNGELFFRNFGSRKFRLKLTDYK